MLSLQLFLPLDRSSLKCSLNTASPGKSLEVQFLGPTPDQLAVVPASVLTSMSDLRAAALHSTPPAPPPRQWRSSPKVMLSKASESSCPSRPATAEAPQDPSVLYPYSLSLGELILSPGFKQHLYADNFPIYILSSDISPELPSHISSYLPDFSI